MRAPRVGARRARRARMVVVVAAGAVSLGSAFTVRAKGADTKWGHRGGPGITNHPVNVVPTNAVSVPQDWPLDARGAITCQTCHTRIPQRTGAGESYLRSFGRAAADAAAFCVQCHGTEGPRSAARMHWMAVRRAHVMVDTDPAEHSVGSLDAESRRCMECHDGVTAREFNNATPWSRGPGAVGDKRRNHPVGVAYRLSSRRTGDTRLRPVGLMPKQVRLPGGKVSCVSCHDVYAGGTHLLSVSIEKSKLCFACHQMD